ncbi:hypothetical protein [Streptomyces sp. NBC_00120]|uniref:Uncharacterized protein n=1 Tax=Streptomyces sp. NBC_00119 TaxID=2975659 RepID=A0AAU1TX79_9ACTN|nr:hypothetical protein [Streptomyces sp. NBC_00120]MCX5323795.1 hypothetical protein [Streptomyces sp. NBC_00120]
MPESGPRTCPVLGVAKARETAQLAAEVFLYRWEAHRARRRRPPDRNQPMSKPSATARELWTG